MKMGTGQRVVTPCQWYLKTIYPGRSMKNERVHHLFGTSFHLRH